MIAKNTDFNKYWKAMQRPVLSVRRSFLWLKADSKSERRCGKAHRQCDASSWHGSDRYALSSAENTSK
jgi:hypothetical protein